MFDGKMKALTFSYDDGVTQDQRLIELFNRYGMKCTFNLNSEKLGKPGSLLREEVTVAHVKPRKEEVRRIYEGHEIAVHTLTHPDLEELPDDEVVRQVEQDRLNLSEIAGYEVKGMAYPCPHGGFGFDERVKKLIRDNTGVKYCRTTNATDNYDLQGDLYEFNPTIRHHHNLDKLEKMAHEFVEMKPDKPQLFYIWGHSYEFDIMNDWGRFEKILAILSGHDDIFYGTNSQVILGE